MSSFKRALIPAIRSARPRPTTLQRLPVVASRPLALRKYSTEPVKPATETPEKPAENPADAATPNYTEVLAEKDKQIASLTVRITESISGLEGVHEHLMLFSTPIDIKSSHFGRVSSQQLPRPALRSDRADGLWQAPEAQ
ncbi:hypothetical protein BDK51DRAFT_45844 [Blyttiomyces helicus]|uniref:Uncharacterized protein n=1 Tax=Blyttiomyces helicus TaxID=388810 RepID=A0A4P9WJI8_9FUNG|nr:hypothetical protein BDK51DRAFT_45844 [Blyttiomyces helicus]|eukprot:RKO91300.1 hypothetical protein BDK51DRAFT_45844 [Blyttiomyces helicus]